MANPSTIWAQLSIPNPAAGSIPFVSSDNITITTNVGNAYISPTTYQFSILTNFDYTGTDSINTYYQQDSYFPYNSSLTPYATGAQVNGTTAGHTVSTSRGTGLAPTNSFTGDFVGLFSGWAYTSTPNPYYMELGGMNIYCSGTNSSANGLGGEIRWFTKQDNVQVAFEWIKLTNSGALASATYGLGATSASLGYQNFPWSNLYLGYQLTSTPATTVTCNAPTGRVKLSSGSNQLIVNNSYCVNNGTNVSIVIVMVESQDATATFIKAVQPASGLFTIVMNANATTGVSFSFLIINN